MVMLREWLFLSLLLLTKQDPFGKKPRAQPLIYPRHSIKAYYDFVNGKTPSDDFKLRDKSVTKKDSEHADWEDRKLQREISRQIGKLERPQRGQKRRRHKHYSLKRRKLIANIATTTTKQPQQFGNASLSHNLKVERYRKILAPVYVPPTKSPPHPSPQPITITFAPTGTANILLLLLLMCNYQIH